MNWLGIKSSTILLLLVLAVVPSLLLDSVRAIPESHASMEGQNPGPRHEILPHDLVEARKRDASHIVRGTVLAVKSFWDDRSIRSVASYNPGYGSRTRLVPIMS